MKFLITTVALLMSLLTFAQDTTTVGSNRIIRNVDSTYLVMIESDIVEGLFIPAKELPDKAALVSFLRTEVEYANSREAVRTLEAKESKQAATQLNKLLNTVDTVRYSALMKVNKSQNLMGNYVLRYNKKSTKLTFDNDLKANLTETSLVKMRVKAINNIILLGLEEENINMYSKDAVIFYGEDAKGNRVTLKKKG